MQMGYDFENERQPAGSRPRIGRFAEAWPPRGEPVADDLAQPGLVHPEWAALRARFLAIHALRRTLATAGAADVPAGSFMLAAESVLDDCRRAAEPVNLVYSGDGKAVSGMKRPVAAPPTPGDRGMQ